MRRLVYWATTRLFRLGMWVERRGHGIQGAALDIMKATGQVKSVPPLRRMSPRIVHSSRDWMS